MIDEALAFLPRNLVDQRYFEAVVMAFDADEPCLEHGCYPEPQELLLPARALSVGQLLRELAVDGDVRDVRAFLRDALG